MVWHVLEKQCYGPDSLSRRWACETDQAETERDDGFIDVDLGIKALEVNCALPWEITTILRT